MILFYKSWRLDGELVVMMEIMVRFRDATVAGMARLLLHPKAPKSRLAQFGKSVYSSTSRIVFTFVRRGVCSQLYTGQEHEHASVLTIPLSSDYCKVL